MLYYIVCEYVWKVQDQVFLDQKSLGIITHIPRTVKVFLKVN